MVLGGQALCIYGTMEDAVWNDAQFEHVSYRYDKSPLSCINSTSWWKQFGETVTMTTYRTATPQAALMRLRRR